MPRLMSKPFRPWNLGRGLADGEIWRRLGALRTVSYRTSSFCRCSLRGADAIANWSLSSTALTASPAPSQAPSLLATARGRVDP